MNGTLETFRTMNYIHMIRIPQGEKGETGREKILKEIIGKFFTNIMKTASCQIDLLATHYLSLCLLGNVFFFFFLPSFLKDSF